MRQEISASERQTYAWVGNTLRVGLYVSIAVMLIGLLLAAAAGHGARVVLPVDRIPTHLASGDPAAVVDLGILLLFATPLAGVLVALARFVQENDRPFTAIGTALVILLIAGFAVALR